MQNGEADVEVLRLLDSVGRRGFAFAWQMLRNHDDALDAVQASMMAAWRNRKRLRPGPELRGWFYRVLRNRCIDVMRSRRVQRAAPLEVDPPDRGASDPAHDAARREELDRLRRVLRQMPDEMREIVLLRDFHDLSYAEIAGVLDIPTGTVMSRLHRARSTLREQMLAKE
ncbi:MAG TPA: RNA polymerase sigma factor [Phycisphaerae bacterium]|nr:RNA polymerase sigma factor [Phycisphaerae bacterium]